MAVKINDIRDQLAAGDELRDVARRNGMSCRMVCRFMSETPKEESVDQENFDDFDFGHEDPSEFD